MILVPHAMQRPHLGGVEQEVPRGVVHEQGVEGVRELKHKLVILLLLSHHQVHTVDLHLNVHEL